MMVVLERERAAMPGWNDFCRVYVVAVGVSVVRAVVPVVVPVAGRLGVGIQRGAAPSRMDFCAISSEDNDREAPEACHHFVVDPRE